MRRITTFIFSFLLLVSTAEVAGQTFYGYRLRPTAGIGFVSFPANAPDNVTQINSYREYDDLRAGYNTIVAGEFVNGDFYTNSIYSNNTGTVNYSARFSRIATDNYTVVRELLLPSNGSWGTTSLWDMSYNYANNTLYGIDSYNKNWSTLFRIDTETLNATSLKEINQGFLTIAFDLDGTCYSIARNGTLYTLNITTYQFTEIGPTGITLSDINSPYHQSMSFDHTTGKLYWAAVLSYAGGVFDSKLYEINKTTGGATLVGTIGTGAGAQIAGLYASYYSKVIPARPADLTVTPGAAGALSATLTWTNPTKDRSGADLTTLSAIVVKRDGVVIQTINNPTIGGAGTWEDTGVPQAGVYTYTVHAVTNGNAGWTAEKVSTVGIDPCEVKTFPYSVSFESNEEIACMKGYSMGANPAGISTNAARTGQSSWRFTSGEGADDYTQYLISPPLAATAGDKVLSFYYNTLRYDTEHFYVGYSTTTNDPASFSWTDHVTSGGTNGWREFSKIFPAETKYIAIRYNVVYRWSVYIDDLTIDVLRNKDVEVVDIVSPVSGGLTANESVTVRLRNNGMQTLTSVPLKLEVNGNVIIAQENAAVNLTKLASVNYTFTGVTVDLSALGKHTVKVTAMLAGDENTANDSKTVQLANFGDCIFHTPFTETFEDASGLACWTITPSSTNTPERSRLVSHRGSYSWRFTSETAGGEDNNQYLITPKIADTGADKKLQFYCFVPDNTVEYFRVGYVTDDVEPDSPAWQSTNMNWSSQLALSKTSEWEYVTAKFPSNVKYFVFNYNYSSAQGSLFFDDISVSEILTDPDMEVSAITSPVTGGDLDQELVTVKVRNVGDVPVEGLVPVTLEVDGAFVVTESIPGPIAVNREVSYQFTTPANFSTAGIHTIKAYINGLTADNNKANDTLSVKITNYGPCKITTLPREFGFEEELSPCWTVYDIDDDIYGHKWKRSSGGHTEGYAMEHSGFTSQDGWLVMPKVAVPQLTSTSSTFLSFWQENTSLGFGTGSNGIWVSTGSSNPEDNAYVRIWEAPTFPASWEEAKVSLYQYAGKEISIAFRYQGDVKHTWRIDDIRLSEQSGKDASVTAIVSPVSNGNLTTETVTIKVKNEGAEVLNKIPVSLRVNNHLICADTVKNITLAPLQEMTYNFSVKPDFTVSGIYTIVASTGIEDDINKDNDRFSKDIYSAGTCEVTQFPYYESFELADFIGEDRFICWTVYDMTGGQAKNSWRIDSDFVAEVTGSRLAPHDGSKLVYHDYGLTDLDGWLVSPRMSIPSTGAYGLSFWSFNAYSFDYGNGKNSVVIMTGSSHPLTAQKTEVWSPKSVKANAWEKSEVNLAAYAGKDVYIAFRYQGNGAHTWIMDDISIEKLTDYDAGVSHIVSPVSGGSDKAKVSVEVTNYGQLPITSVKAGYFFNNGAEVSQQFSGLNIASGQAATLTFDQTVDVSTRQETYRLKAYVSLPGDNITKNDTLEISFKYRENFKLYGYQLGFDGAASTRDLSAVSFNVVNPASSEKAISDWRDGTNLVSAGEYYNDNIYIFTRMVKNTWQPANFVILDKNWEEVDRFMADDMPDDMTYDYSTNTMYAMVQIPSDGITFQSDLKTVDLITGATTTVVRLNRQFRTLAAKLDGTLYGVDHNGRLCIINTTGQITDLGRVNIPWDMEDELQSMTFDHVSGELYWAYCSDYYNGDGRLIEINTGVPSLSVNMGAIGKHSQIVGLHSIYPRDTVSSATKVKTDDGTVTLYPNPAQGHVFITNVPEGAVIHITDLSGHLMATHISTTSGTVELPLQLNSGIYLLQLQHQGQGLNVMRKLVIK